jgi:hypothetical protein
MRHTPPQRAGARHFTASAIPRFPPGAFDCDHASTACRMQAASGSERKGSTADATGVSRRQVSRQTLRQCRRDPPVSTGGFPLPPCKHRVAARYLTCKPRAEASGKAARLTPQEQAGGRPAGRRYVFSGAIPRFPPGAFHCDHASTAWQYGTSHASRERKRAERQHV